MSTQLPVPLQSALNTYKTNYAAFKATGNTANKTAYEGAMASINTILESESRTTAANDDYLRKFISKYETENEEIDTLRETSREIQKEGPEIQNKLAQSNQLYQRQIATANDTGLYIKAGIVVALVVIVGIVGAL
jgi:tRNA C32,U32 (ribose-2'-O)-methylase TrmJ